jgi:hypothetical protein
VVFYRVAAGVLGLGVLGVLWLARRTVLRGQSWAPPVAIVGMVLLALMGVAGVLLSGYSAVSLAFGESSGVGADLAGGVVALVVAVAAAIWAVRRAHRVPKPAQS